ncbi:MAG TPA: DUF6600 domain-containing protein [Geminicoccus sp.]|uniref:DUF6600 domain-containing protein n=1 Tax=Geminicoccus sp. TaxID=2024832 RepID=UPI002BF5C38D|nr:DUF6600 domain-containing protein [Geminicoccus sp.]HWL67999.1 DUF6600 domain-containing protein [Geminicoccus sp.]
MRRRLFLAILLPAPALAQDLRQTLARQFRDQLKPLGVWDELPGLGPGWRPDHVPDGWRPFSSGRWRWTREAGWYWQGDLPFSALAEHRGRWRRIEGNWWWLPGSRFDPAPVAWAAPGSGQIAWAPLASEEGMPTGWSVVPLTELTLQALPVSPLADAHGLRRRAPPDPAEIEAAGGRLPEAVPLASLATPEDVRAWYATDSRSVFGIGTPGFRPPPPGPTPAPTGPSGTDDAWQAFDRQHRLDLLEAERRRELDRERDRDRLR